MLSALSRDMVSGVCRFLGYDDIVSWFCICKRNENDESDSVAVVYKDQSFWRMRLSICYKVDIENISDWKKLTSLLSREYIDIDANPNVGCWDYDETQMYPVKWNSLDMLKFLTHQGAFPDWSGVLFEAVKSRRMDIVHFLAKCPEVPVTDILRDFIFRAKKPTRMDLTLIKTLLISTNINPNLVPKPLPLSDVVTPHNSIKELLMTDSRFSNTMNT